MLPGKWSADSKFVHVSICAAADGSPKANGKGIISLVARYASADPTTSNDGAH